MLKDLLNKITSYRCNIGAQSRAAASNGRTDVYVRHFDILLTNYSQTMNNGHILIAIAVLEKDTSTKYMVDFLNH